jgi:hypothetical protein
MRERAFGFRSALRSCSAPATEREFSVLRTAVDLALKYSLALGVPFRSALRVAFRLELSGGPRSIDLSRLLGAATDLL